MCNVVYADPEDENNAVFNLIIHYIGLDNQERSQCKYLEGINQVKVGTALNDLAIDFTFPQDDDMCQNNGWALNK